MKMKYFLLGLTLLVLAGAAWTGRAIYRARHNLVTLDVYNAPLADVIHQIEWQTREKIIVPPGLDSKVTLTLKNVPLEEALGRLGNQIGANWSKWHAVYNSARALNRLEAALKNRLKIEDIGWTNLAPHLSFGDGLPPGAGAIGGDVLSGAGPGKKVSRLDRDDVRSGTVMTKIGGERPAVRMVTRTRDGSGAVTEEFWSPENVVLEESLLPKLGVGDFSEASDVAAQQVAGKVKGRLATLFVLGPAPVGLSFGNSIVRNIHSGSAGDTNAVPGELPPLLNLEAAMQRAGAENFTRFTPEQRVQRAREKQVAKAKQQKM